MGDETSDNPKGQTELDPKEGPELFSHDRESKVNDDVVRRILTEERLRQAIQSEVSGPRRASALWAFLNSALGLLLVSSIVIAGLGRLYADYRQQQTDRAARAANVERLMTEIDYRIGQIELAMPRVPFREEYLPIPREHWRGVWQITKGSGSFQPAWPEFKGVPLYGLMSRLSREAQIDTSNPARKAALALASDDAPLTGLDARQHTNALLRYRAILLTENDDRQ